MNEIKVCVIRKYFGQYILFIQTQKMAFDCFHVKASILW